MVAKDKHSSLLVAKVSDEEKKKFLWHFVQAAEEGEERTTSLQTKKSVLQTPMAPKVSIL